MRGIGVKLLIVFLLAALPAAAAPLIAVDVGHSFAKPGATSARGVPEFEFNLRLARAVAAELETAGYAVRLVGADGLADDLFRRPQEAADAALFLSLHHDSVHERYLRAWQHEGVARRHSEANRGYSLFLSSRNPREARSLFCAQSIGYRLRQEGVERSQYHLRNVSGANHPVANRAAGVLYYDKLIVLRTAAVPAVLFEAGVIINRQEEALLSADPYRARLAKAVAQGVRDCVMQ
jgi:N-acetylmuramoyl-L-alanine amidase